ncbi:metal ABC transporter solute-binding protein, Zn/Mn family [Piscibacillus halophilus]|uniref:Zinc transport system substrate-binding protein n=1 Tax=Piscibacillus halophilus TaxID=571933 RepID=A0A1H9KV94_9BACI|nr:zinc ABC transporter substrate-binding protein [Piscibacillus halophilus]SER02949.1 zinc transport system substrate-binding protein [Piscibacillus halophilus]
MRLVQTVVTFLLIGIFVVGCSAKEASNSNEDSELTIYTSIYPFQFAVEQIAGDTVTVNTVYPPGADAHTYEPTSQDMIELSESDAFIYLGAGMEGFSENIASTLDSEDVKLIEMGQYDELFNGEKSHEEHDHHAVEDDHAQKVEIVGLSGHYHTGDSINLTAKIDESIDYDHLHWFTLNPEEEEWMVVDGQTSDEFEGEAEVNGQQIKAELYGEDHEVVAKSEPITIEIDDHGDEEHSHEEGHDHDHGDEEHAHEEDHDHDHGEEEHAHEEGHNHDHEGEQSDRPIEIDGVLGHYHTGDAINLTARIEESIDYDHLHWFILNPEEEEWIVVDGQTSDEFEGEAEVNDQQIKVELYGKDHEVVGESEPVTIEIDDHEGDYNPHFWIDPLRMIQAADIIKDELIKMNPEQEEMYNENFEELKEQLTDLDDQYLDVLSTKENKAIIVSHAAFGYWEERYGINQININGLSSAEEPSQKQLIEIINQSKEHNIDYVLFEQNSSNRLSEVVRKEIEAEPLTIHNLSVLTEEDIDQGEDYISLMEYNLEILDQITK